MKAKRIAGLFVLIALGGAINFSTARCEEIENLLPNPGFEVNSGTNFFPDGWSGVLNCAVRTNEDPHLGRWCMAIKNLLNPNGSKFVMSELVTIVDIKPDTKYILSVYARAKTNLSASGGDGYRSEVGVSFFDSNKERIDTFFSIHPAVFSEWKIISLPFTSPPNIIQAYVFLRIWGSEQRTEAIYYDDVSLIEVTNEYSKGLAATNIVPNFSFELTGGNFAQGWNVEQGIATLDSGRNGGHSVKITWKPLEAGIAPVVKSDYIAWKGKKISASCWMRTSMVNDADPSYNASCDIEFYSTNKNFIVLRRIGSLNGTTTWEYLEKEIGIPANLEEGYLKVQFAFNKMGYEAWLDDVTINIAEGEEEKSDVVFDIATKKLANIFSRDEKIIFYPSVQPKNFSAKHKLYVEYEIIDNLGFPVFKSEGREELGGEILLNSDKLSNRINEYLRLNCRLMDGGGKVSAEKKAVFGIFTAGPETILPKESRFGFYEVAGFPGGLSHQQQIKLHQLIGARITRPCFDIAALQRDSGKNGPLDLKRIENGGFEHDSGIGWEQLIKDKKVYVIPNVYVQPPEWALSQEAIKKYGKEHEAVWKCSIEDLNALSAWTYESVKRFKGVMKHWVFHNEPPFQKDEWVEGYIRELEAFYKAAKKADPDCIIIAPATCGGPVAFEKFLAKGVAKWCDVYSVHLYAEVFEAWEKGIKECAELMKKYNAVKPIYDFETGLMREPNKLKMAEIMVKAHVWHLKYGYEKIFWFGANPPGSQGGEMTLIDEKALPYPGFFTYKVLTDKLEVPTRYVAEIELENKNARLFLFQRNNNPFYVLWNEGNKPINIGLKGKGNQPITVTDTFGKKTNFLNNNTVGISLTHPVFIEGMESVSTTKSPIVFLNNSSSNQIKLEIENVWGKKIHGLLKLEAPEGWKSEPLYSEVEIAEGESKKISVNLQAPVNVEADKEYPILAELFESSSKMRIADASSLVSTANPLTLELYPSLDDKAKSQLKLNVSNSGTIVINGKVVVVSCLTSLPRPEKTTVEVASLMPKETREIFVPLSQQPYNITLHEMYKFEASFYDARNYLLNKIEKNIGFRIIKKSKTPVTIDASLAEWSALPPLYSIDRPYSYAQGVRGGNWDMPQDLSCKIYAKWDADNLYLAVEVTDDIFRNDQDGGMFIWSGDAIQIAFQPYSPDKINGAYGHLVIALTRNGPKAYRAYSTPEGTKLGNTVDTDISNIVKLAIKRVSTKTIYEIAIPAKELSPIKLKAGNCFGLALQLNDDDGNGFTGFVNFLGWEIAQTKEFNTVILTD